MVKFATFDCYGTLIDWKKGISDSFKRIVGEMYPDDEIFKRYVNIEAKREGMYDSYRRILEMSFKDLAAIFGLKVTDFQARQFAESITEWPGFNDSAPALKELGKNGIKRIILSNVDRDILEKTITQANLEVDGFVTAEDVRSYKPNLAHWKYFFTNFNASPENTVHIAGSIYHDIEPATKLGLKAIWVNRYGESSGDYGYKTISDLKSIARILNEL
ncbi:MAG: haloacid dehalogenase type II [Thermoplasmatales archaeon]